MLRAILGVIVGFIIMNGVVFGCFAAAWYIFGANHAYNPGVWDVSITWLIMITVVNLIAGLIGGATCAVVASKQSNAAVALVTLVIIFGIIDARTQMRKNFDDKPTVREGEFSMIEAVANSRQPTSVLIANPIIGVLGVLIGAGYVRKRGAAPAT